MSRDAPATGRELIEFCKDSLAAYEYPRQIEFRDALPTNAARKVLKSALVAGPARQVVTSAL